MRRERFWPGISRVVRLLPWSVAMAILPLATMCMAAAPKGPSPDDQYKKLTPDSEVQPGVPQGKLEKFTWDSSKIFPGTTREVTVYVPAQYDPARPAAVFVCQDGVLYKAPTVFDNLIARKEMPVVIGIFIQPGGFPLKPGEKPHKRPDGRPAPRQSQPGVRYPQRRLRPLPVGGNPAQGGREIQPHQGPRGALHRRQQQRRHLRLHRLLAAAR